jgi:hypothetical protein
MYRLDLSKEDNIYSQPFDGTSEDNALELLSFSD